MMKLFLPRTIRMAIRHRRLDTAFYLLALIILIGCRPAVHDQKPNVYPVSGQLFCNDKPAHGAVVMLQSRTATSVHVTPIAMVGADGVYHIGSFDQEEGAPTGDYDLLVVWPTHAGGLAPDRLQGTFSDPAKPVASLKVIAGVNLVPAIHLKFQK